jgi:hypothetical protein
MAYVYRHIRLDKNEPFYIGIGTSKYYNRAHRNKNRSDLWKRIAKKGGYEVEILMDGLTWEQACEKEKEFISLYGRIDLKTGCLANMTNGGEGNLGAIISEKQKAAICESNKKRIFTDEDKKRMSNRMRELNTNQEFREKINKGLRSSDKVKLNATNLGIKSRGKKLSELTKKKISDSKFKIAVIQYDLYGNFIKEWPSLSQIQKENNMCSGNISKCCKGCYKQVYGYIWKYKN